MINWHLGTLAIAQEYNVFLGLRWLTENSASAPSCSHTTKHLLSGTPGRSRTDTGDPFRGPASSLGLRGLGDNTPRPYLDSRFTDKGGPILGQCQLSN